MCFWSPWELLPDKHLDEFRSGRRGWRKVMDLQWRHHDGQLSQVCRTGNAAERRGKGSRRFKAVNSSSIFTNYALCKYYLNFSKGDKRTETQLQSFHLSHLWVTGHIRRTSPSEMNKSLEWLKFRQFLFLIRFFCPYIVPDLIVFYHLRR